MINHVLHSLPLYSMAVFVPLRTDINRLEMICSNFLWGEFENDGKCNWINCKRCCLLMNEGGIGIRRLDDMNTAFAMKLWWQFCTSNSLWAKFMKMKYCFNSHATDNSKKICTTTWQRIFKVRDLAESHMKWVIGRGQINFWKDNWLKIRNMGVLIDASVIDNHALTVREAASDSDKWKSLIVDILHQEVVVEIESMFSNLYDMEDICVWTVTSDGSFSFKSSWDICRDKGNLLGLYSFIGINLFL